MLSEGRRVDWEDLQKKKKKKARNPWASELEKDETDRSGEDGLGKEACMAVLDDALNKTKTDGGRMNEIIETMAGAGSGGEGENAQVVWRNHASRDRRQGGGWEFWGSSGLWNREWRKTKI